MARRTFKHTPNELYKRLETHRNSFLCHAAREKIDELMALVSFDQAAYRQVMDAAYRWDVLPEDEKQAATDRFSVCCAVYCLMVDGMEEREAIMHLLQRCELSYRNSGIRKDWQQSVRALGLRADFNGIRALTRWNERLVGLPQGREEYLALVPDEVLERYHEAYLNYALECKSYDYARTHR